MRVLLGAGSLWVVCLAVVHIRTHRHECSLQSIQVYVLCLYTTYICTYLSTCTVTTALCACAHGQGSMLTYKVHVHTWCRIWWTVWATRTALDDTVFLQQTGQPLKGEVPSLSGGVQLVGTHHYRPVREPIVPTVVERDPCSSWYSGLGKV